MDNCVQIYGDGLPNKCIYKNLLQFLDESFSTFKFPKESDGSFKKSEDEITKALVHHMDRAQELKSGHFKFNNQEPTSKVDIGVYAGRDYDDRNTTPFFVIEAKRLPTPKSSQRDPNEYVYITPQIKGHGGIERFKIEKHGKGHAEAAMFGYIQDGTSPLDWKDRINEIIRDVAKSRKDFWSEYEILRDSTLIPNRFYSTHSRISEEPILLWHFFEQEK